MYEFKINKYEELENTKNNKMIRRTNVKQLTRERAELRLTQSSRQESIARRTIAVTQRAVPRQCQHRRQQHTHTVARRRLLQRRRTRVQQRIVDGSAALLHTRQHGGAQHKPRHTRGVARRNVGEQCWETRGEKVRQAVDRRRRRETAAHVRHPVHAHACHLRVPAHSTQPIDTRCRTRRT